MQLMVGEKDRQPDKDKREAQTNKSYIFKVYIIGVHIYHVVTNNSEELG